MDPGPAGRRDVEPELRHLSRAHADEVEIAGVGEPARRVSGVSDGDRYGGNPELFGMFAVTRRTRIEILVPLRRDLSAGMQNAVVGLIGQ